MHHFCLIIKKKYLKNEAKYDSSARIDGSVTDNSLKTSSDYIGVSLCTYNESDGNVQKPPASRVRRVMEAALNETLHEVPLLAELLTSSTV